MEADERASLRADLARVADGDRAALEPAFARLHPLVLGFCRRLLDGPTAEDAAQEALVNLFARSGQYDAERDPVPWALAFASNACRTARKRTIRRREQAELPDLADDAEPDGPLMDANCGPQYRPPSPPCLRWMPKPWRWRWGIAHRAPPSANVWNARPRASGQHGAFDEPTSDAARRL